MERIDMAGIQLDVEITGNGPPLIYLHSEHYLHLQKPFIERLADDFNRDVLRVEGLPGAGYRLAIDGEVLVNGVLEHIEIWNPKRYEDYSGGCDESYEDVAETVWKHAKDKQGAGGE